MSWGGADGLFEDDAHPNWARPLVRRADGQLRPVKDDEDFSGLGAVYLGPQQVFVPGAMPATELSVDQLIELHTESEAGFLELQSKLVRHFKVRRSTRSVHWLRTASGLVVRDDATSGASAASSLA